MTTGVNIVLVDDHRILRDGLRLVLERETGFRVVGEAGDVRGALECVRQVSPDLVVLDVQLPDGSGLEVGADSSHPAPGPDSDAFATEPELRQEALRIEFPAIS